MPRILRAAQTVRPPRHKIAPPRRRNPFVAVFGFENNVANGAKIAIMYGGRDVIALPQCLFFAIKHRSKCSLTSLFFFEGKGLGSYQVFFRMAKVQNNRAVKPQLVVRDIFAPGEVRMSGLSLSHRKFVQHKNV